MRRDECDEDARLRSSTDDATPARSTFPQACRLKAARSPVLPSQLLGDTCPTSHSDSNGIRAVVGLDPTFSIRDVAPTQANTASNEILYAGGLV